MFGVCLCVPRFYWVIHSFSILSYDCRYYQHTPDGSGSVSQGHEWYWDTLVCDEDGDWAHEFIDTTSVKQGNGGQLLHEFERTELLSNILTVDFSLSLSLSVNLNQSLFRLSFYLV